MPEASNMTPGYSLEFDHRGHRVGGEIDLDAPRLPTTISKMTEEAWAETAEADRQWRAEHQP
jgi:hypothetical protein